MTAHSSATAGTLKARIAVLDRVLELLADDCTLFVSCDECDNDPDLCAEDGSCSTCSLHDAEVLRLRATLIEMRVTASVKLRETKARCEG